MSFHFSLIFWGLSGPALNMEGHEAQHASLAAHTVRVRNREQRFVRLSGLGQPDVLYNSIFNCCIQFPQTGRAQPA